MTRVIAIRYPTSTDMNRGSLDHLRRCIDVEDANTIKNLIGELLFNVNALSRYNYCLIKHQDILYAVEPVDYQKNTYVRKQLNYHPLNNLFN